MAQFSIGVDLLALRQPFRPALLTVTKLKADGVAIDARGEIRPSTLSGTGIRQLNKLLDDLRLKVASVRFQTRRGFHDSDDLERRIDAAKEALDFAYALGCNVVTTQLGTIPDEDAPAWPILLQALDDVGRHSQKAGAMLAARTGAASPEALRRLIDALPDGALFVDFDPGGLVVHGHTMEEGLSLLGRDILHVHACDGVRDLGQQMGVSVTLGRGIVDFPLLIASLDQYRYRGYLTVAPGDVPHPRQEAEHGVLYLRALT